MSATQPQQSDASDDDGAIDQVKPIPDEDGPHDVPDDKVIEKTLPTAPIDDSDRPS
jgi:hypothetical protein